MAVRKLPKDVLKMASGLISPSGLAGHRRQLCIVPFILVTKSAAEEHDEDGGGQQQPRQDVQEGVHAQIQPAAAHQH